MTAFLATQAPGMDPSELPDVMTDQALTVLAAAVDRAAECGHDAVDSEHLLWAAMRHGRGAQLVRSAGVDPIAVADELDANSVRGEGRGRPAALTAGARRTLSSAHRIWLRLGGSHLGPEHLVLGMAADQDSATGDLLARHGVDQIELDAEMFALAEGSGS